MARDSAEIRRRFADDGLASTLASTGPVTVNLVTSSPLERERHQLVRDAVGNLAAAHALLNKAEQARRLAQFATLGPLIAELRDTLEELAKFTRAMADVVGVTTTPKEPG